MRISDWSSDVCSSDLATITIDRPEKRNAMSFAVLGEFHAAIARAADDEAARAVIITGAGGAFCAGTDLSNLANTPPDERSGRGADSAPGVTWAMVECPKQVNGAIDGPAVGMGRPEGQTSETKKLNRISYTGF